MGAVIEWHRHLRRHLLQRLSFDERGRDVYQQPQNARRHHPHRPWQHHQDASKSGPSWQRACVAPVPGPRLLIVPDVKHRLTCLAYSRGGAISGYSQTGRLRWEIGKGMSGWKGRLLRTSASDASFSSASRYLVCWPRLLFPRPRRHPHPHRRLIAPLGEFPANEFRSGQWWASWTLAVRTFHSVTWVTGARRQS